MKNSGLSWDEVYVNPGEDKVALSHLKKYEPDQLLSASITYKAVVLVLPSDSSLGASISSATPFPLIQLTKQPLSHILCISDMSSCVVALKKIFMLF